MKIIKILIFGFMVLSSLTSLNINSDYRDNVVGSYNSKEYYRHLTLDKIMKYDTSRYTITISKKNYTDSFLILTTHEGTFDVKLNGNKFNAITTRCFGRFSGDSIYVTFIPSIGPTAYRYAGKK